MTNLAVQDTPPVDIRGSKTVSRQPVFLCTDLEMFVLYRIRCLVWKWLDFNLRWKVVTPGQDLNYYRPKLVKEHTNTVKAQRQPWLCRGTQSADTGNHGFENRHGQPWLCRGTKVAMALKTDTGSHGFVKRHRQPFLCKQTQATMALQGDIGSQHRQLWL